MGFFEVILISISLAMDAFAVSICKGMTMIKMNWKKAAVIGTYFGIFQMLMPTLGFLLGFRFADILVSIDHWIAFILLGTIGIKMIKESFEEKETMNDNIDVKTMIVLAIATSIDALAVGMTYAFLEVRNIFLVFGIIGGITFLISVIGVKIGNKFGDKFGSKAEFIGGAILLFIGAKILLEHIGII